MLVLFIVSLPTYGLETLVLASSDDPIAKVSFGILQVAYQSIGYDLSAEVLPAERALILSNTGTLDGEVNRIKGINKKYRSLLLVPVKINTLYGQAFTKTLNFPITGWESLRPYKIGIRIGTKFAEKNTKGMDVVKVENNDLLFKMLDLERLDVVVTSKQEGLLAIKKLGIVDINFLQPALMQLDLFHYLHIKHKKLVPLIEAQLKKMKKAGEIPL